MVMRYCSIIKLGFWAVFSRYERVYCSKHTVGNFTKHSGCLELCSFLKYFEIISKILEYNIEIFGFPQNDPLLWWSSCEEIDIEIMYTRVFDVLSECFRKPIALNNPKVW